MGKFQDEDIIAAKGRFGPYVKYKNIFASLGKGEDPLCVTLERAIELVTAKEKKELDKIIKSWDRGCAGARGERQIRPVYSVREKFFRIPTSKKPQDITLDECLALSGLNEEKKKPKVASAKGKTRAKTRKAG